MSGGGARETEQDLQDDLGYLHGEPFRARRRVSVPANHYSVTRDRAWEFGSRRLTWGVARTMLENSSMSRLAPSTSAPSTFEAPAGTPRCSLPSPILRGGSASRETSSPGGGGRARRTLEPLGPAAWPELIAQIVQYATTQSSFRRRRPDAVSCARRRSSVAVEVLRRLDGPPPLGCGGRRGVLGARRRRGVLVVQEARCAECSMITSGGRSSRGPLAVRGAGCLGARLLAAYSGRGVGGRSSRSSTARYVIIGHSEQRARCTTSSRRRW